ncbi:MAG: hypothetical protein EOO20_27735 [Chryseobacterium sp.]|nr:MAG: hypothetical protein EOO20_27735 [Chryseobacterium sp.]
MKQYFLFLIITFSTLVVTAQVDTTQHIINGRINSVEQQQRPYVIMISADGFRYDYAEKYNAVNLLQLSATGIRAASMIPSFPALTFPNHYSLVTGMYPSHHGLVDNNFFECCNKANACSNQTIVFMCAINKS